MNNSHVYTVDEIRERWPVHSFGTNESTWTVGMLKQFLSAYPDEMPVVIADRDECTKWPMTDAPEMETDVAHIWENEGDGRKFLGYAISDRPILTIA